MRYRQGPAKAITSTAHKLARNLYTLVTTRQFYDENVLAQHEHQTRARKTRRLKTQAAALGFDLVPVEAA